MIIRTPNGCSIEITNSYLTGKESVFYEGEKVSSKFSLFGSLHVFQIIENGESANYEVELKTRWHGFSYSTTVRRNGMIIYSDK